MRDGMRIFSYERRLKLLNLHFLERRRTRGDLIEAYKWLQGYNKDVRRVLIFSNQDRTRNNGFKLDKCRFNTEMGRNWFTNRVVDDWNKLISRVVNANSIDSFKRRLDKFMEVDTIEYRWS